jgi:hypothetical protein
VQHPLTDVLASPKRDWVVGDVRGVQEVTIDASMASNIFAFKYLLGYFAFMAVLADRFGRGHEQQARRRHDVLATLASKISRYLAPQVYSSIFSGRKDVTIETAARIAWTIRSSAPRRTLPPAFNRSRSRAKSC